MKSRQVTGGYLVRLDRGEEVISALSVLAAELKIPSGIVHGIGAVDDPRLGSFDTGTGKYCTQTLNGTFEVVNLTGNIAWQEGRPFVHVHAVVAAPDQTLLGGHFFCGTVAVTMEIYIRELSERLTRTHDPERGFNFWDL